MKCTNKKRLCCALIAFLILNISLAGCSRAVADIPYSPDSDNKAFVIGSGGSDLVMAKTFASDLCVSENNLNLLEKSIDSSEAGGLFDATTAQTLYAKNVHNKMNPASLTKVMTAYLALKYGHLEDTLTASQNVLITESGAQLIGLKEGDRMTLDQAINILMIYSANDAAVMIAEYLSGSTDKFADLMNKEALKLGATNTHFVNPHGLTADEHYTTAYDLYLIFNAAMQYEEFRKIINTFEYKTTIKNREGESKNIEIQNTNGFLKGDFTAPDSINVIGGKTGTTKAAGSCLILLSNGSDNHTYVSVILHSENHESLYKDMISLLSDIN